LQRHFRVYVNTACCRCQVSYFNPEHLEREAFGGEETLRYGYAYGGGAGGMTQTRAISRNAFVLFYDRVAPKPTGGEGSGGQGESKDGAVDDELVDAAVRTAKLLAKQSSRRAALLSRSAVPPAIFEVCAAAHCVSRLCCGCVYPRLCACLCFSLPVSVCMWLRLLCTRVCIVLCTDVSCL
jgi:hypothetical protein